MTVRRQEYPTGDGKEVFLCVNSGKKNTCAFSDGALTVAVLYVGWVGFERGY